ncbi:PREDICTED: uncharacterized protein LOC109188351 [Ipomoea nil]|uniref:uncharacterized protein LOC109188351 n=1 Tax=Ipomoea nil TaxID=35883 RepID=UPI0009009E3A|nr:PREDICTED: uncharacterized protein LOC109188351 [Ipomoea nil]
MATAIDSTAFATCFSTKPRAALRLSPPSSALLHRRSLPNVSAFKLSANSKISRRAGSIVCEASDIAFEVPSVTKDTWESLVLQSSGPVVVEFWASWCGPCRMFHPVMNELSKQYSGRVKCFKLNTDDSPSVASQYGIRSIPTVMIFLDGKKKDAIIGAVPKTTLTACVERYL